jgi:RNA-directed DNA polymerase
VSSADTASVRPLERPLDDPGKEAVTGTRRADAPVEETDLRERVREPHHRRRARHQVRRHQGAPGIDGMTVDDREEPVKTHGPTLRAAWGEGTYAPQPVRRTEIPTAGGGMRTLGIPTVRARGIAPALRPGLQEAGDPPCAERSAGVRPPRRAQQAVEQAPASMREGDTGVVAIDLEKCCDGVNHDVWRSRVRRRVKDRRGRTRIHRFLNAGVLTLAGRVEPTAEGTPPGGPRSPLLATRLRDAFDQAREKRGPRFARDADEATIAVRSRQAGERVMARVRRGLEQTLRRQVNEAKSAVDRPWNRTCLGCTCTRRRATRRRVSDTALTACTAQVRAMTRRTRGRTMRPIVTELGQRMLGWRAFFGVAEGRSPLRALDQWIRRRRRSYHGQHGGRKRDWERRQRGVGRQLAWNTVTSAHGPWRLRQRPARAMALPQRDFAALGRPSLGEDGPSTSSAEPPET